MIRRPGRTLAAALAGLFCWSLTAVARAEPPPTAKDPVSEIARAVAAEPARAAELAAHAVASSPTTLAARIVGAAVGALPPGRRKALAPAVVGAAIRALPAAERATLAPACACAAIRAVPQAEHPAVVPALAAAAVNAAPVARAKVTECALEAAPGLGPQIAAAVTAAAAPLPLVDLDATTGSPLPGGSTGRDALQRQRCASAPCPG